MIYISYFVNSWLVPNSKPIHPAWRQHKKTTKESRTLHIAQKHALNIYRTSLSKDLKLFSPLKIIKKAACPLVGVCFPLVFHICRGPPIMVAAVLIKIVLLWHKCDILIDMAFTAFSLQLYLFGVLCKLKLVIKIPIAHLKTTAHIGIYNNFKLRTCF